VRRAAAILAVLLTTTAAQAQNTLYSPHKFVEDPEGEAPLYKRKFLPPDGWMPSDQRLLVALSAPIVPPTLAPPLEPVVMNGGKGGLLAEHYVRFWAIKQQGASVEMRGGCWSSACTTITAFIPKERLCFAPGAFLAFHAARRVDNQQPSPHATLEMYASYPAEIRDWIDVHGGPAKMTVETFWTTSCGRSATRGASEVKDWRDPLDRDREARNGYLAP
jgi:hypothetical protein